ncbi:sucrose-phosphate synthase [Fervidobacterium thailandense]|uniref:sucrose-phosphate synthase n=1 Tax=Fervidobacterium thailandense TaxID=1008305 RepID=A0A1E3G303_9BACT|nr:sucrose-phosphate synthase [Fervidobacterium thailandense]
MKRVAFFNPQGNFDRHDSHLTEHPDFGGQLVYVKELAKAMGELGIKVDIVTRLIVDSDWPEFSEPFDFYPDAPNVRIVRIPFGGERFLRKEDLWPYIPEYVDNIYKFYESEGEFPDFVTTHYADGGMAGVLFLKRTGIPFSFTGHSLGAWKKDKLLASGASPEELEKRYRFTVRIYAENMAIKYASFVACSTSQEMNQQYSHPDYNHLPYLHKFKLIPPGINQRIFTTTPGPLDEVIEKYLNEKLSKAPVCRYKLPFIIMSSRVDRKKNHISVVRAFINHEKLINSANLLIVLRGVENVEKWAHESESEAASIVREILNEARGEINRSVFFLNITDQPSLASLYRVASKRDSVFVLPAIYEPFGLAIVEAAACGLKVVATKNGGPSEILANGEGLLVDPEDPKDIAEKLLVALKKFPKERSLELAKRYTWENTARGYLTYISEGLKLEKVSVSEEDVQRFLDLISAIH